MLTKEECEKALNGLRILEREENFKKWNQVAPQIKCDVIESLIHAHYDNPPLKLEEIRPDDWVWDKENKEWRQVNFAGVVGKDDELMFYEDVFKKGVKIVAFKNFRSVVFEENRFYRKEVQE